MTDVDRARQCEAHLTAALTALDTVMDETRKAGESYPDDYAKPVYRAVLGNLATLQAYLTALKVPAKAYRGES